MNRRQFLGGLVLLALSGCKEEPVIQKAKPREIPVPKNNNPNPSITNNQSKDNPRKVNLDSDYSRISIYDNLIRFELEKVRGRHPQAPIPELNLVKAQIYVEGRNEPHFSTDPMQVAASGSNAYDILPDGTENSDLIGNYSHLNGMPINPQRSIETGIGWFMHKSAIYGRRVVESGDVVPYVVRKGDHFVKIAKENGSNIETLEKYNPGVDSTRLKVGQQIYVKKAVVERGIAGWKPWKEAIERYNGGGDPKYLPKVLNAKREIDKISFS